MASQDAHGQARRHIRCSAFLRAIPPCLDRRGRRLVETLGASTKARFETGAKTATSKVRRFKEFYDAASWSRAERIVARVEAGPEGADTRFIVTNLAKLGALQNFDPLTNHQP